jgi:hypothetical protein
MYSLLNVVSDSTSDFCYAEHRNGHCLKPSQVSVSKSSCCCSTSNHTMAWGVLCSPCPIVGSAGYSELCPHGPGMTFFGEGEFYSFLQRLMKTD